MTTIHSLPVTLSSAVSASIGRSLQVLIVAVLLFMYCAKAAAETPADDPAWRNFQHALSEPAWIGANAEHPDADGAFRPLPEIDSRQIDPERFRLGFRLFHEGRLSSGNSIACVTCHAGALSGADRRRVSIGVDGARGTMNALSVFNAAFNFRQFWDGRAVTLEEQALEPIENEVEMAHSLPAVLRMLQEDEQYPERFSNAYPDGITVNNLADALGHFQRHQFVRRDTPFQRALAGETDALSEQEQRGLERFLELGCVACHNGINLGGNSYQSVGALQAFYGEEREADEHDDGLFSRSGREQDRHVFRVPSLHGVGTTSPYFHDGRVSTLDDAVRLMARHNLARELDEKEVDDLVAFLRALHGTFRAGSPLDGVEDETRSIADSGNGKTHEQAYRQSLSALPEAWQSLSYEAQRIQEGAVAHYDFLQFQHLEMIRHSRALHHPPAVLDDAVRSELIRSAQVLLEEVQALEWIIADFLRARAQLSVYESWLDNPPVPERRIMSVEQMEQGLAQQARHAGESLEQLQAIKFDETLSRLQSVLPPQ